MNGVRGLLAESLCTTRQKATSRPRRSTTSATSPPANSLAVKARTPAPSRTPPGVHIHRHLPLTLQNRLISGCTACTLVGFPFLFPSSNPNNDSLRLTTCGRQLPKNGAPPLPCKPWFKAMASISTTRRMAAGEILAPASSTPWGLLCLLLVLFGVSFGCNDGHDAFLFFPVAPLASTTATDALVFVSRREPARFLGGSAANTVGYRPSHQHHTQPRHHAAALVVRQPIESPGLVVGNGMSIQSNPLPR